MRRGERAQRLISDDLLKEAFTTIEAEIAQEWRRAPARDVEGRERLFLMVRLLDKLKAHFESVIADGRMAAGEIAEFERKRRFLGVTLP